MPAGAASTKRAPARQRPRRQAPRRGAGPSRVTRRRGSARATARTPQRALPVRLLRAPAARALQGRATGVLDSLLHGRGWIALVGVLLVGIVFFNVDLLQMNREIARTASRSAVLKRENSGLRVELARLASTERIQDAAASRGLVLPPAGQIRYVRAGRGDARRAARRVRPPGTDVQPLAPAEPTPVSAPVAPAPLATPPAQAQPGPATPGATTAPPAAPGAAPGQPGAPTGVPGQPGGPGQPPASPQAQAPPPAGAQG